VKRELDKTESLQTGESLLGSDDATMQPARYRTRRCCAWQKRGNSTIAHFASASKRPSPAANGALDWCKQRDLNTGSPCERR
jgi:hypothetical protein